MSHRIGRGAIRTPGELRRDLTIPIYYILIELAHPAFPHTSTSGPSQYVTVVKTSPNRDDRHESGFPVYVNYRQWEEIIVPILQDPRWRNWLGSLGGEPGESEDGYPTSIPKQTVGPGLYACNDGLRTYYLDLLGIEIENKATDA